MVREAHETLAEVFMAMDQDSDGLISEQDFLSSYEIFYKGTKAKSGGANQNQDADEMDYGADDYMEPHSLSN